MPNRRLNKRRALAGFGKSRHFPRVLLGWKSVKRAQKEEAEEAKKERPPRNEAEKSQEAKPAEVSEGFGFHRSSSSGQMLGIT